MKYEVKCNNKAEWDKNSKWLMDHGYNWFGKKDRGHFTPPFNTKFPLYIVVYPDELRLDWDNNSYYPSFTMESTMSPVFVVYNEKQGDTLQHFLFSLGYRWYGHVGSSKIKIVNEGIALDLKIKSLTHADVEYFKGRTNSYTIYDTLDLRQIQKIAGPSYPTEIGDYKVEYSKAGIKVGCQSISLEDIRAILKQVESLGHG